MLGTPALPQRTAKSAARPTRPPAASPAAMRCSFRWLFEALLLNCPEVVWADRGADTGADRGAIVLRRCRPLTGPREFTKIAPPDGSRAGHELAWTNGD